MKTAPFRRCGYWRSVAARCGLAVCVTLLTWGCDGSLAADSVPASAVVPFPDFASLATDDPSASYDAATSLVNAVAPSERTRLLLPINSPLRRNWSNLPESVTRFDRNGLRLGDLGPDQLALVFRLLAAGLGEHGYRTVEEVVMAEAVLADTFLAWPMGWSATNYWIAVFGEPGPDGAWGWQFGGHHLAVNASFWGHDLVSLSPTFVGVEPADFVFEGDRRSPLADELADALALLAALPREVRDEVLLAGEPGRLRAGPGNDGVVPPLEGSVVGAWPEAAQGLLVDLVSHWLRLQDEANALRRIAEVEASLDETRFVWQGAMDRNGDLYFRVQGPSLLIEFSTEGDGDDAAGHLHSVYRDPTNDYGGELLAPSG